MASSYTVNACIYLFRATLSRLSKFQRNCRCFTPREKFSTISVHVWPTISDNLRAHTTYRLKIDKFSARRSFIKFVPTYWIRYMTILNICEIGAIMLK